MVKVEINTTQKQYFEHLELIANIRGWCRINCGKNERGSRRKWMVMYAVRRHPPDFEPDRTYKIFFSDPKMASLFLLTRD